MNSNNKKIKWILRLIVVLGIFILVWSLFINVEISWRENILVIGFVFITIGIIASCDEKMVSDIQSDKIRHKKVIINKKYRSLFMCNEEGKIYRVILVSEIIRYIITIIALILTVIDFFISELKLNEISWVLLFLSYIIGSVYYGIEYLFGNPKKEEDAYKYFFAIKVNNKIIKFIKFTLLGIAILIIFITGITITKERGFLKVIFLYSVGYLVAIIYGIYYVVFNVIKFKCGVKKLKYNKKKKLKLYIKEITIGSLKVALGITIVIVFWFVEAGNCYKDIPYYKKSEYIVIEGVVEHRECHSSGKGGKDTSFIINNEKFLVADDNKDIIEGKMYKIKYLPNSEYIVSIVEETEQGEKEIEYYQ